MENGIEAIRRMFDIDPEKEKAAFSDCVESIRSEFRKYSVEDVAISLFVSNMWLPNIASQVKHQLLIAIFATVMPEEFSTEDIINTYEGFSAFLEKIYNLLPAFPSLEDYIPEPDWGEIKFHHDEKNYKMFYGNELSNVNEYLEIFQMVYGPYKEEYYRHCHRDPALELRYCLTLQETIIEGITAQPDSKTLDIEPGHIEIPPKEFWENAKTFYTAFVPDELEPAQFKNLYTLNLGEYPRDSLEYETFGNSIFDGTLIPAFFIKNKARYYPILPRRYSAILFDSWSETYRNHIDKIEPDKRRLLFKIGARLHQYVKYRIPKDNIFYVASAVEKDGKPHNIIFTTAFIAGNKLILIYLLTPKVSSNSLEKKFRKIAPELNKAIELASQQPATLALHLDRQNVQFRSEDEKRTLQPEILIIIPQVSTQIRSFGIPVDLPGRVMFLDSFLGMIDELENPETLADFFEYLDEIEPKLQTGFTMLDKFASYKDSQGILIGGALEPDFISIDPHWGTSLRYKTLSSFWEEFPEHGFFGHPQSWKVKKETDTRIRLVARGYFGSALYSRIGPTEVSMTAPFDAMDYPQGSLSNLLMECLEDSMSRRESIFTEHAFFKRPEKLHIIFFPLSMVVKDEKFKHVRHLCGIEKYWCSDLSRIRKGTIGVRVVFNDEEIRKTFNDATDCSLEVDILLEVLARLDELVPDKEIGSIIEKLEKTKPGKPRFKMFAVDKPASFPEFISPLEPEKAHFKRAKKRIAEIASQLDVQEGEYHLEEAKTIINRLRDAIVAEINSEVSKYDFTTAIPFLLTRIDALNAENERHRHRIKHSLQHETDYQPEVRHAEKHTEFIKTHKNYRYIIEKLVQIEPKGKEKITRTQFQYFIALIDWLHVLYSASDNLHYGILPVGMKLDRDFLLEVMYEPEMETKEKQYSEMMAQLELGLIGKSEDRVESPRPVEELLNEIDKASIADLGFSLKNMVNALQILSFWPTFAKDVEESTSYKAASEETIEIFSKNIPDCSLEEAGRIIDFLTLKKEDVIRVLGQEEPCSDLPVWEYRKRYARYNLRPIIKVGNQFHWGAYSARRTALLWSATIPEGRLPTDLQSPNIEQVIASEKKLIEDALADKTFEIVKRHTPLAQKNLKLDKLEPKGHHPQELGDYDVLSFHQDKNIILNIECKDLLQAHSLKDARRLREKIFGIPGKSQGYFEQINRREDYLKKHLAEIARALRWPIDEKNPPKIITIYLSRNSHWWTSFPSEGINAEFLRADLLSDFINKLHKKD